MVKGIAKNINESAGVYSIVFIVIGFAITIVTIVLTMQNFSYAQTNTWINASPKIQAMETRQQATDVRLERMEIYLKLLMDADGIKYNN